MDVGAALRSVAGDPVLLAELAAIFAEDMPPRVAALQAALASGDASRIGDIAHALKGAAGALGSIRVQALAADQEARATDAPADSLRGLVTALAAEVERAITRLTHLPGSAVAGSPPDAGEARPAELEPPGFPGVPS